MTFWSLVQRNLRFYWRANLAVIAGVATAVAVLGGALVVGKSVQASLLRLAIERLGRTESVISAPVLFREELAKSFGNAAPVLTVEGLVTHQSTRRRATGIPVYGVNERFWKFHQVESPSLSGRDAAISTALAAELGAKTGDTLLLRIEKPADIPAESLFGRKDDPASAIRLKLKAVLDSARMGEFSLRPTQAAVRALFVPLPLLQKEANAEGRVNTILLESAAAPAEQRLRTVFALEDLGLQLQTFEDRDSLQLTAAQGVIAESLVRPALEAGSSAGMRTVPLFTYLATDMAIGGHHVPYSLIAAADLREVAGDGDYGDDAIVLNDWTARDLGAKPGDSLTLEYMEWHPDNRITTERAQFTVARVVPMRGLAGDRDLTPDYPGITDADNLSDWDPPFTMDLNKIRPKDEDYWHQYRTTPKAFVQLKRAQELWKSRWGSVTTIRYITRDVRQPEGAEKALYTLRSGLRSRVTPASAGLAVMPIRQTSLTASRGATDFGEYFTYFSFFLMVSALLLAGLFFRLGTEQRFSEIGVMRAMGFSGSAVRRIFLTEGLLLAVVGGAVGMLASVAYSGLVLLGLTTLWLDAVGTQNLTLSIAAEPLLIGFFGGVLTAAVAVFLTLRGIRQVTPRGLMTSAPVLAKSRAGFVRLGCFIGAVALLAASAAHAIPAAGAFFGAGAFLLAGALAWIRVRLSDTRRHVASLNLFAFRNAGFRPGRTVLATALIASATFLIVSVEAFRRDPHAAARDLKSGTGGFALMAESVRPLYYNPQSDKGRETMPDLPASTTVMGLRLRPGDDASCLNLYEPQDPRILGVPPALAAMNRFSFSDTSRKVENPWALLDEAPVDGAVPAIADANSMTYVLHRKVGDVFTLSSGVKLRLVGALSDSAFQSELMVSEQNFQRLFPREQGYRVFLIDTPTASEGKVTADLESALSDYGFDVTATADRLASYHRVENAYLSTFQSLGALGLLVGTIGLAAVLFRNVLERRRDLALLTALGYTRAQLAKLVLMENLLILGLGILVGAGSAALAIAPVIASRGVGGGAVSAVLLVALVFVTGALATWVSTRAALRLPMMAALRAG